MPTDRQLEVLRLMHGGVRLESHGGGIGHLKLKCSENVRSGDVRAMIEAGWLTFDGDRWVLTESGKDFVRVKDDVTRFVVGVSA